jgi:hypothetical protein
LWQRTHGINSTSSWLWSDDKTTKSGNAAPIGLLAKKKNEIWLRAISQSCTKRKIAKGGDLAVFEKRPSVAWCKVMFLESSTT